VDERVLRKLKEQTRERYEQPALGRKRRRANRTTVVS
jgi:hypothetical protein